jgi:transcriptional regulator with PAS, ATPase and Fis domain
LDEVSELPLLLQAKLLRVLQEGEIERLGATQTVKVNVRVIATSNRDLPEMIRNGGFREDLYYRLNVVPLEIPPLRLRPKDVELLARLFMEVSCVDNGLPVKELTVDGMNKLLQWRWPGNIRELQNVLERSVLLAPTNRVSADDILIKDFAVNDSERQLKPGMTVSEAERWLILKTLESTNQNRTKAAQLLGISIRTLRNKINEYKDNRAVGL